MGPGDHKCTEGQARIATEKKRDKHDHIICQEKVDGSNVGVAKVNGEILAIGRAGYLANTSPFIQHHLFHAWVESQKTRFAELLDEGERLCGEWLAQAHGTRYKLQHEPFVAFDLMVETRRAVYYDFIGRVQEFNFTTPHVLYKGDPFSIENALESIKISGHGAIDPIEGAVWRVHRNRLKNKHTKERIWVVDFLVKYVRPDKVDGLYLPEISGMDPVWNWYPNVLKNQIKRRCA